MPSPDSPRDVASASNAERTGDAASSADALAKAPAAGQPAGLVMPRTPLGRVGMAALLAIVVVGCADVGQRGATWAVDVWRDFRSGSADGRFGGRGVPWSKLPGPPRGEALEFHLDPATDLRMQGQNDPAQERWADIAGNHYSEAFCSRFSYEVPAERAADPTAPSILLRLDSPATTLKGRLEARNLKPNFAYQIKLAGDWKAPLAAEIIGYAGRWRLPGGGTNFTDADYRAYPNPAEVEAYILFDFFVTDAQGNAVRNFALDSSLHVLWNAIRQREPENKDRDNLVPFLVDASSPQTYARPKAEPLREVLYAEREHQRYPTERTITLAPGTYDAFLVLTEESFHGYGTDNGYWATVARAPLHFTILAPETP